MYGIEHQPKGHRGYMSSKDAPEGFHCDVCEYYAAAERCNNRIVIGWATDGKYGLSMAGSLAKVDPKGCSDEFEPR